MQRLTEIKGIILSSLDKNELYNLELELTEIISRCYRSISLSETTAESIDHKADLSMANALLGVCKNKQIDAGNEQNRINHNFRCAAKLMLTPETYNRILDNARLSRSEVKSQKNELKANRVSE